MGSRLYKKNFRTLAQGRTAVPTLSILAGVCLLCFISSISSLVEVETGIVEDESHAACAQQIVADNTSSCGYGTSNLNVESDGSILWTRCATDLGLSQEAAKILLINHTVSNPGGTLQLPQLLQQYAKQAQVPLEVTAHALEQWSIGDAGEDGSPTTTTSDAQFNGTTNDGVLEDDDVAHQSEVQYGSTARDMSQYAAWALVPSNLSAMVADSLIQPLDQLLSLNSALQAYWQDIPQVFRDAAAVYDGYIVGIPYTAEIPLVFWRRDILQLLGLSSVPSSWEELLALARQVHGMEVPCLSDNSSTCQMYGFCLGLPDGCFYDGLALTAIWASMVGAYGTKGGLFFDPLDMQPLFSGPAMLEALRNLRELFSLAPPVRGACRRQLSPPDVERCGLGLGLSNVFKTVGLAYAGGMRGRLGVSLLPGSHLVQNRRSGLLEPCTKSLCPYATLENNTLTNQMALVNRVPYLGRGAYSFGLNRRAAPNHALAALRAFTYAITYEDGWPFALDPNTLTMSVRALHLSLGALPCWTAAGYEAGDTAAFLGVVADSMQHPSLAVALRMRGSVDLEAALGRAAAEVLYNDSKPDQAVQVLRDAYANMLRDHYDNDIAQFQQAYWRDIGFKPETSSPTQSSGTRMPRIGTLLGGAAGAVGALAVALVGVGVFGIHRRRLRIHGTLLHRPVEPPGYSPDTSLCITDIQSSTTLWEALEATVMDTALSLHNGCVRGLLPKHGGYECHTEGDSFIIAFPTAAAAVAFALEMQSALLELAWPSDLLEHEACATVYRPALSMACGPAATLSPPAPVMSSAPSQRSLGPLCSMGPEAYMPADHRPPSGSRPPAGAAVASGAVPYRREGTHRSSFGTRGNLQRQQQAAGVGRGVQLQEAARSSGLELEGSCRALPTMDGPDPLADDRALPFSAELLALHSLIKRQSGVTLLALRGVPTTAVPLMAQESGSSLQQHQRLGIPQAEATPPPSLTLEREEMQILSSCAVNAHPFRSTGVTSAACFAAILTATAADAAPPSSTVENAHCASGGSTWLASALSGTAMRGLSRTLYGCPVAAELPSTARGDDMLDGQGSHATSVSLQLQADKVYGRHEPAQSRRWLPTSRMTFDGQSAVVQQEEALLQPAAAPPAAPLHRAYNLHPGTSPGVVASGAASARTRVEGDVPDNGYSSTAYNDAAHLGTVADGHPDCFKGSDFGQPATRPYSSGINMCASGAAAERSTHGVHTSSVVNESDAVPMRTSAPSFIGLEGDILPNAPLGVLEPPATRLGAETSPGAAQLTDPLGSHPAHRSSHSISCGAPRAWAINSAEPAKAGLACSMPMATLDLGQESPTLRLTDATTQSVINIDYRPKDENSNCLTTRSGDAQSLVGIGAVPGAGLARSVSAILACSGRTIPSYTRAIHETSRLLEPASALLIELPTFTPTTFLTLEVPGLQRERSGMLPAPAPSRRISRIGSLALGSAAQQGPSFAASGSGVLCFRGFRVRCGIASGLVPGRDVLYRKATSRRMAYSGACMRLTKLVSDAAVGGMVLLSSSAVERLMPLPRRDMPGLVVWHKGRFQLDTGTSQEPAFDSFADCSCGGEDLYQALATSLAPRQLLLERLHLRTGPQLLPGLLAAPMGSVTLALVQVVGLATLMAWDEDVTRGSLCLLHRTALALLRTSGGYPAAVQDGRVLAAFTNAPSAVRWLLALEEELRCVVDWPPQLLAHELGDELTVIGPQQQPHPHPQPPSTPFLSPIAQGHDAGAGLVDGEMSSWLLGDTATAVPVTANTHGSPASEFATAQAQSWPVSSQAGGSEGFSAVRLQGRALEVFQSGLCRGAARAAGVEGSPGRTDSVNFRMAASSGACRRLPLLRSAEREGAPRSGLQATVTASWLAGLGGGDVGQIGDNRMAFDPALEAHAHTLSDTSRSLPIDRNCVLAERDSWQPSLSVWPAAEPSAATQPPDLSEAMEADKRGVHGVTEIWMNNGDDGSGGNAGAASDAFRTVAVSQRRVPYGRSSTIAYMPENQGEAARSEYAVSNASAPLPPYPPPLRRSKTSLRLATARRNLAAAAYHARISSENAAFAGLPLPPAAALLSLPAGSAVIRSSATGALVKLDRHTGCLGARLSPMEVFPNTISQPLIGGTEMAMLQHQGRRSDLGQRPRSTAATAAMTVGRGVSAPWAECTPHPSRAALEADAAQDASPMPGTGSPTQPVQRCVLRGLRVRCGAEEGTFFLDGSVSAGQLYGSQHGGRAHSRLVKLCSSALMGQVLCSGRVAKRVRRAAAAGDPLAQQMRVTPLPPAAVAASAAGTGGVAVARSSNQFLAGMVDGSYRYVRTPVAFDDGGEGEEGLGPERTSGLRRSEGPLAWRTLTVRRQGFRASESSGHPKADVWVCNWAWGSAAQNGVG